LLQALGLRSFSPAVTTCPGCGRTAGDIYQRLAEDVQAFIREKTPAWRKRFVGVENLRLAVMGCIVNGPGESKAANIGISLPGAGEAPHCPVFVDGKKFAVLNGTPEELSAAFLRIVVEYVEKLPPRREDA
jgi:(E)-4-hydroxy-3-methylbut-2-enyl-diphosphate synthase